MLEDIVRCCLRKKCAGESSRAVHSFGNSHCWTTNTRTLTSVGQTGSRGCTYHTVLVCTAIVAMNQSNSVNEWVEAGPLFSFCGLRGLRGLRGLTRVLLNDASLHETHLKAVYLNVSCDLLNKQNGWRIQVGVSKCFVCIGVKANKNGLKFGIFFFSRWQWWW